MSGGMKTGGCRKKKSKGGLFWQGGGKKGEGKGLRNGTGGERRGNRKNGVKRMKSNKTQLDKEKDEKQRKKQNTR